MVKGGSVPLGICPEFISFSFFYQRKRDRFMREDGPDPAGGETPRPGTGEGALQSSRWRWRDGRGGRGTLSDILRRAAGTAANIRDLYRKLSRAQAAALVILFVLAGIAFAGAALPRGGSEWRRTPAAGDGAAGTGD